MTRQSWLKALAVWLLLMAAETIHGIIRTLFLVPRVGDFRARQIGVFSGSLIILALVLLRIRWIGVRSTRSLLAIGLVWLALTLAFEIGLGRLSGYSWERIASDYNVRSGGLLPFGLAVLALSPLIAARVRGVRSG
jgi:hypothetical protein